jgi:hypothetical protein
MNCYRHRLTKKGNLKGGILILLANGRFKLVNGGFVAVNLAKILILEQALINTMRLIINYNL